MSPPFAIADIVPIIIINQDKKNNRTLRICRDLMPPNRLCYQSTNRIHKTKGERIMIVIKIESSDPYSIFIYPCRD
jgi:hypothetical protein